MKATLRICILLLIALSHCYAADNSLCSRFTGSWYGAFWYKDPRDCHINNGCRHSMLAEVTYQQNNHYKALIHPSIGHEVTYLFTCDNGQISSSEVPGYIQFSCVDKTICQVKYDDDRLSANLLSAGV